MARRIIYNPVDFVDASAPFYENIIGIISDQTDRISRNIELAREEKLLEEDRAWQENQLQLQLDARRESLDKQIESQEDQNRLNRHQNQMQHLDQMQYNWAKLGLDRMSDAQRAADSEVQEAQKRVDAINDTLRDTALIGENAPLRYTAARDPQSGDIFVVDNESEGPNGRTIVLGTLNDFINNQKPLVDFADQFLDGKNVVNWIEDNLARGDTYEDAETGASVIDKRGMLNIISQIRSGQDDGTAMKKLNAIMDRDSDVRLLYKNDPDAPIRDPLEVATNTSFVKDVLFNANNFGPLFDEGDSTRFRDEIEDTADQFMPMPVKHTFANMPNKEFKGQTIGVMEQSYMNYRSVVDGRSDEVEKVGKAVSTLNQMALDYLTHNPNNIPEGLRHVDKTRLARSLRIRSEEFMSNTPDLTNMFIYPETEEQVYEIGNRGAARHKERVDLNNYLIKEGLIPDNKEVDWEFGRKVEN